jgi:imidazolonepropionase-like amidohydrolase
MNLILSLRPVDLAPLTVGVAGERYVAPGEIDAPHLDLTAWWALPGLADCHAHLSADSLEESGRGGEIEAIRRRAFAQLAGGVFLVIDKGWRDEVVLRLLDDPPTTRPDLEAAGRIITGPSGYFPGFAVETDEPGLTTAVAQADPRGGWVKLVGDWPQKGRGPVVNFEEEALSRAVAVAHAAGVRVAVHTMAPLTPGFAVRAGVDSIEHGLYLTPDDLAELSARNGAWVPTVVNTEDVIASLGPGSTGARVLGQGLENVLRLLPAAAEMGANILCGTDLGLAHGEVAREALRLGEYGLAAPAVVAAAGPNAYRYLGRRPFQPGSDADLILFDSPPPDNPSVLLRPVLGLRAGRVVFDRVGLMSP